MVEMLLPDHLRQMKLGMPKLWTPKFIPVHAAVGLQPPPLAYGRQQNAQRIEGFNDTIGDCMPTGIINGVIDFLALRGTPMSTVPNSLAQDIYSDVTGYVAGDASTDNGTDPDQMWAWWMQHPILGWKLSAPPGLVDPRNDWAVKTALNADGFIGLVLALALEQQNELIWTATGRPGSWGYHYVNCDGYDGPYTATSWGLEKQIDESFFDGGFVAQVYKFTLTQ